MFFLEKELFKIKYTPEILREFINSYFFNCEKEQEVPTKIGMYLYLKINNNHIDDWKRRKKNHLLRELNLGYQKINHMNLQRFLKGNTNASSWYLERAFVKEYHIDTKISVKTDSPTNPIVINLDNKGKNKC